MERPRGQRDDKSRSNGQKKMRVYLSILLGVAVLGALVWFLFLLPDVTADNRMGAQCKTLCSNIQNSSGLVKETNAIEYCTESFDLGGSEIVEGKKQKYCTDGAHCFSRYECNYKNQDLDLEQCINLLHNHYMERNGETRQEAAEHVAEVYDTSNEETGVGSCSPQSEWYQDKLSTASGVLEAVR